MGEPARAVRLEAIRRRLRQATAYRVRLTRDHEDVKWGSIRLSGPPGLAWTDLFSWTVLQGQEKASEGRQLSSRWGVDLTDAHDMLGHLLVYGATKLLFTRQPRVRLVDLLTSHRFLPTHEGKLLTALFFHVSARLLNETEREPALVMSPLLAQAFKNACDKALEAVTDGKPKDAQRHIGRANSVLVQAAKSGKFRKTGGFAKGRARNPWATGEIGAWAFRAPSFEHLCTLEFWSAVEQGIGYQLCARKGCYRPFPVQRGNFRYCPQCRSDRRTTPEPSSGDKRIRKLLARNPRIGRRRVVSIVGAFHRLEVTKARRSLAPAEQRQFAELHRQIYEV